MLTVWNAFDDLFRDELWSRGAAAPRRREYREVLPAVDIAEREDAFVIHADVPGMSSENVEVTVDKNVLTFEGERHAERKDENTGWHRVERRYGSFKRSFTLPETANLEGIEADVQNGVLTIVVPKAQAAAPRKVKVGTSSLTDKAKKLFSKGDPKEEAASH